MSAQVKKPGRGRPRGRKATAKENLPEMSALEPAAIKLEPAEKRKAPAKRKPPTKRKPAAKSADTAQAADAGDQPSAQPDMPAEVSEPTSSTVEPPTTPSTSQPSAVQSSPAPPKSEKKAKGRSKKPLPPNHLITEYFAITSRKRKTSKEVKEDEDRQIVYHLEHDIDPISALTVVELPEKGRGVQAIKPIAKGEFVCEYRGDLIQIADAKQREQEYEESGKGCYMYYFAWNNRQWCIDATEDTGRLGRLINHSRKTPNCRSRLFIWRDKPHLIFFALNDIQLDEELLYDYGDTRKVVIDSHPWLKHS